MALLLTCLMVTGCADDRPLHVPIPDEIGYVATDSAATQSRESTRVAYSSLAKPESAMVDGVFVRTELTEDPSEPQVLWATTNSARKITAEQLVVSLLKHAPDWLPLKNERVASDGREVANLGSGYNKVGESEILTWTWTNESADTDLVLKFEFKLK